MITEFSFTNWQAFRGTHTIKLGAKAYAITAQYESDAGRSNWAGKSALLEAIEFVLTGRLNKDRRFDADGWITRGEKEGSVSLTLEDGTTITRSRKRGQSTQIRMSSGASQDEAAAQILKHLAFEADDFQNVAYFAQGAMARIIRTESEKRFSVIQGWLGLARAELAEESAKTHAVKHVREVQRLKAKLQAVTGMLSQLTTLSDEQLATSKARQTEISAQLEEIATHNKRVYEQFHERQAHEKTIKRFEEIIERGKAEAKAIEQFPGDLRDEAASHEAELTSRHADYQAASRNTVNKRIVLLGKFDGKCPVSSITCPAKDQINSDRETASATLEAAQKIERTARAHADAIAGDTNALLAQVKQLEKHEAARATLRQQAEAMRPEVIAARRALKAMGEAESTSATDEGELRNEYRDLTSAIVTAEADAKTIAKLTFDSAVISKEIAETAKLAAVATQTRAVFRATQRRVAERALNSIGRRANAMLLNAGVDLKIDIQWEYEGKNLARACEMCGVPFPASAKVKVCTTCGADRGQNIIQSLDFILSDRSGAADDFAGIAMQLAAGSWLLTARQSPWATALIDEPFSQMDQTIRRAAAKQLVTLAADSAFRQVLVISHSSETISMYPARINIVVSKDGTRRIEVM